MKTKEQVYADLGITLKGRWGQFICKHDNKQWFREHTLSIRGERRRLICLDCGKPLATYFAEYEGNGFK